MPPRPPNDAQPPPNWPKNVIYLTKPRLAPAFPTQLIPFLIPLSPASQKYAPRPISHPGNLQIKTITTTSHPAQGQLGLYARQKIQPNTLIIPYLGILHHTFTPTSPSTSPSPSSLPVTSSFPLQVDDKEEESDYDLSLLRISAYDVQNPFQGVHISIGIDAAKEGNAGRFVNDFRGIAGGPNAEFRLGKGERGELRMEIWSLKVGVGKGDEILVSYGKGWWAGRSGL